MKWGISFVHCVLALTLALCGGAALAAQSDYSRPRVVPSERKPQISRAEELYNRGTDAVGLGNFAEAEKAFSEAARLAPNNAAVFNMLAYSQRKQGKLDYAFINYQKALKLRPRFPQAREYLGEAHLQAVQREIEILKSYGPEGKESLEDLTAALKSAAVDADK